MNLNLQVNVRKKKLTICKGMLSASMTLTLDERFSSTWNTKVIAVKLKN